MQPFGTTNLLLEVMGDGLNALSSSAMPVHILELTTSGTLVQNLVMQNSGTAPASRRLTAWTVAPGPDGA